jgi:photosynthetic reaction center cytochrome c subunit
VKKPTKSGFVFSALLVFAGASSLFFILQASRMGRPPVSSVQLAYRGTGLDQLYSPRAFAKLAALNKIPFLLPPADPTGDRARDSYDNVRVLGNLSTAQVTRLMASMTTWVAPKQGCVYCHNLDNMALDTKYTKVVARRMLQMTQNINANWQSHVKNTGVTCYTCHRGNPVPKFIWYNEPGPHTTGMAETQTGMGHPTPQIDEAALPYDPFTPFLENRKNIRVQGKSALPTGNRSSMKQAEWTYSLMIVMATSLGVNCDYCHNTRAFSDWSQSRPQRVTAWYGIRMVRDLNDHYLDPLNPVFPVYRKGALGDSPKVYCATCHQGVYKPLFGKSMLTTFKTELGGPPATTAALMAPYVEPPDTSDAAPAAAKSAAPTPPGTPGAAKPAVATPPAAPPK